MQSDSSFLPCSLQPYFPCVTKLGKKIVQLGQTPSSGDQLETGQAVRRGAAGSWGPSRRRAPSARCTCSRTYGTQDESEEISTSDRYHDMLLGSSYELEETSSLEMSARGPCSGAHANRVTTKKHLLRHWLRVRVKGNQQHGLLDTFARCTRSGADANRVNDQLLRHGLRIQPSDTGYRT